MNRYIDGLQYPLEHPFRRDAENLYQKYNTDTFKQDGVLRWKSNGRVPPQDVLEFWKFVGYRFNMSKSVYARNKEEAEFIEQYRANQKPPTQEQLAEMRAAFGPGVEVVDVFTGRKIRT